MAKKILENKVDELIEILKKIGLTPDNSSKEMSRLTSIVERMTPPIPAIPAIPAIINNGDHDLLLAFRAESLVEFKTIKEALVKLQDSTSIYITRPEFGEVIRIQADHETRTRVLETFKDNLTGRMIALGGLSGLATGIIMVIVNHFWR
jgi:hypothetical protein